MFVKICGVTTAEDALLAAGLGADAVGLNFVDSSPRRISATRASSIVEQLPSEVLTVGIFRNELKERVVEISNAVGLRAVQLHGHETPEDSRWIGERVPALIKVFAVKDPALQAGGDYGPHRLLIDSPLPGSGEVFDWTLLEQALKGRSYILAGGLNPTNVAQAIEMLAPWGVDVASGVESSPGRKDPAKVRRFIAAARAAADSIDYSHTNRDDEFSEPVPSPMLRSAADNRDGLSVEPASGDNPQIQPFDWEENQ
ncbi:MAG: phosphoribosylanthranilate isomerase [Acidimicrobiales bacterium]